MVLSSIICDQNLLDKSILGRLGLIIKRIMSIHEFDNISHQTLLGLNYE